MKKYLIILLLVLFVISYRFTIVEDRFDYVHEQFKFLAGWNLVKRYRVDELERRIKALENEKATHKIR